MDKEQIIALTQEYGSDWGTKHSERLIHLVSILGEGIDYDTEVIWMAAYLHDWGGYQKWMVQGMEHYDRSAQVAEQFLRENDYPEDFSSRVVECIAFHHGGDPNRSIESRLFTDADALDLLGVCGTLRCFAMNFRNLQGGLATTKKFRELSIAAITTDKGREMAKKRMEETEDLLKAFGEETFGIY